MTTGTILIILTTVYYTFRVWHHPELLKQDLLFSAYPGRIGLLSGALDWVIFIHYVLLVSALASAVFTAALA